MAEISASKTERQPEPMPRLAIGLASALGFVAIWSGFIVFSRLGVTGGLTPYDVAALRYAVAGLMMAPFAYAWWPRHLSLGKSLLLAATGPGTIYSLMMYAGLSQAPAAYAGVFSNGLLPVITAFYGLIFFKQKVGRLAIVAIAIILLGCSLIGLFDRQAVQDHAWLGALLFLAAAFVLSAYIVGVGHWRLTPRQSLVVIAVPNAIVILPLWHFFLPSTLATASWEAIAFQALFQGLGPSFLAVIFYTLTIRNLGSTSTAGISAIVPATATLLAIPVLGEWPSSIQWLGVATVSIGLAMLLARRG